MERTILTKLWKDSWDGDVWIAPWAKAVAGLTVEQAAWSPAAGRHSIWQNVVHVTFWRNYTLTVIAGRPKPSDAEVEKRQFAAPERVSLEAWAQTCAALKKSHDEIGAALASPSVSLDRLQYHLMHDAYHLGQIMQLRALQGLQPIM